MRLKQLDEEKIIKAFNKNKEDKIMSDNKTLDNLMEAFAGEAHAGLYQEALENLDQTEEIFYYLCPVCGNIVKLVPEKCSICSISGDKFIKY